MTDKPRRKRSTRAKAQARAAEAFSLHLTGLSYGVIAHRLGYGNMGNAHRAIQRYIDALLYARSPVVDKSDTLSYTGSAGRG